MKSDRLKIKTTKCFKSKYEEKQCLKKIMAFTESRASQSTGNKISSIYNRKLNARNWFFDQNPFQEIF